MNDEFQAKETAVVKEANQHKESLEENGNEHATEILNESRKEIQEIKRENQQLIDSQISKARVELKKESESLALSIMEKILDRRLAQ